MARQKRPRGAGRRIKGALQREKFLRLHGISTTLKLTLLGATKRGGVPLRAEKLRRKLPQQLKGVGATEHIKPLNP